MRVASLLVWVLGALSAQDRVPLLDGSHLDGRIISVHQRGLEVEADSSSRRVLWTDVAPREPFSSRELSLTLVNGDRITGRLMGWDGKHLHVSCPVISELRIPVASLALPPDPPATTQGSSFLKPSPWTGKVSLLGTLRAGNVDSTAFQLNGGVQRQWETDRFAAEGSFSYGETEGAITSSSARGRAKWDHYLDRNVYLYGLGEAEWDDVKNLDLRLLLGGGAGFNLWRGKSDRHSFDFEFGGTALYENFEDRASSELRFAGRLAASYRNVFFEDLIFTQSMECLAPLPAVDEFILRSTTKAEVAVSAHWYVQHLLELEYRGDPPPDTKSLDIRLLFGLEYKF